MPFKKGQSGNPKGRKKGSKNIPQEFIDLCREHTEELLKAVVDIARKETSRDSDRIKAAEMVIAYAYGKPTQALQVEGSIEMPQEIVNRPPRIERTEWLKEHSHQQEEQVH